MTEDVSPTVTSAVVSLIASALITALFAFVFQQSFNAIPGVGDIGFFAAFGLIVTALFVVHSGD